MDLRTLRIGLLATTVMMVVGGLGTWATAFGGLLSVNGGDRDGAIVIVCAVIIAIGALVAKRALAILAVLAALVATATAIYDTQDILGSDGIDVGWGLWLSLVASVAAIPLTVLAWRAPRAAAADAPAPTPPA